jgi:hypothetical protein
MALDSLPAPRRPFHNPKLSFTAIAISCSDPRYRSVVCIDECPSKNLICSRLWFEELSVLVFEVVFVVSPLNSEAGGSWAQAI